LLTVFVHHRFKAILLALAIVMIVPGSALSAAAAMGPAQTVPHGPGDPPALSARAAILIDEATGRVLYHRNADQAFVPASLAKLMSLHIIYERLADRSISRSDVVSLSSNAWAQHQAPGSTLMNLEPGQIVTVEELMKGMAVASGNDAATALAEYVAGSAAEFVRLMNEEARFMGYTAMHFADPAGVSPDNSVTAREFADFSRRYIDLHPEALDELHSLREFDYPLAQNMPNGRLSRGLTKKQYNGNYLVWDGIGVDGLKTGHLDDNNFTAAITARRGDTRLIAVLLGLSGRSLADGARIRAEESRALLTWGFDNYATLTLDAPALPLVRVWKGAARRVAVAPAGPVRLTTRVDERPSLSYSVLLEEPVVAPVLAGQKLGDIVYTSGSEEVARIPLLAREGVDGAGFLRRVWDGALLGISTALQNTGAALATVLDSFRPLAIVSTEHTSSSERRTP
jgi:D-alanyl-D-alanine carboxypeptidase (penicillin-binding protein 5/6)